MISRTARLLLPALTTAFFAALPSSALAEPFEGEFLAVHGGVAILDIKGDALLGPVDRSSTKPVVILLAGFRTPIGRDSPIVVGIEGDVGYTIDDFDARFGISTTAGYRLGDSALVYGRAGYASRGNVSTAAGDSSADGLMLGGGAEFAVSDRISIRADYRNLDLGSATDILGNTLNFSGHEITGGVVLNF